MYQPCSMKKQIMKGFTLVELLIVVIILAILAAIVVPQFSSSTDDANVAALDTTLANMRSAIDMYYQQHGEYPGDLAASGATCTSPGTAGTGGADSAAAFSSQLSMYTNKDGQACSTSDGTYKFGPYLKKSDLPNNPITLNNALAIQTSGDLNMSGATTPAGWKVDIKNGKFIADDNDLDAAGVGYDKH